MCKMKKCKNFILAGFVLWGFLSSCHISKSVYVPEEIANLMMSSDSLSISDDRLETIKSIMKTKEFKKYAKALQRLDKKMEPYIAKLDKNEVEALRVNRKDADYVSAFVTKLESGIDVGAENIKVKKTLNDLEDVMEGRNLSVLEKTLLLINARKSK